MDGLEVACRLTAPIKAHWSVNKPRSNSIRKYRLCFVYSSAEAIWRAGGYTSRRESAATEPRGHIWGGWARMRRHDNVRAGTKASAFFNASVWCVRLNMSTVNNNFSATSFTLVLPMTGRETEGLWTQGCDWRKACISFKFKPMNTLQVSGT